MNLGRYSKFAVAVGAVATVVGQVLADGVISPAEIGLLTSTISGALLVYVVPNAVATEGPAEE